MLGFVGAPGFSGPRAAPAGRRQQPRNRRGELQKRSTVKHVDLSNSPLPRSVREHLRQSGPGAWFSQHHPDLCIRQTRGITLTKRTEYRPAEMVPRHPLCAARSDSI